VLLRDLTRQTPTNKKEKLGRERVSIEPSKFLGGSASECQGFWGGRPDAAKTFQVGQASSKAKTVGGLIPTVRREGAAYDGRRNHPPLSSVRGSWKGGGALC